LNTTAIGLIQEENVLQGAAIGVNAAAIAALPAVIVPARLTCQIYASNPTPILSGSTDFVAFAVNTKFSTSTGIDLEPSGNTVRNNTAQEMVVNVILHARILKTGSERFLVEIRHAGGYVTGFEFDANAPGTIETADLMAIVTVAPGDTIEFGVRHYFAAGANQDYTLQKGSFIQIHT